ncbi:MAG: 23S rRNA (guanosine(2251)-2'-O)-methyltransferase RlmB [Holosporales bacterium]|jgi:23S rRNA (guanosine2251-2'-O)-methyltransferase|nr:23S rRNA (guanosine(2251)-2'-O)-methyltransferase RlmB [Holosporales bacterium]
MLIYGIHACRSVVINKRKKILRIYLLKNKNHFEFLNAIPAKNLEYINEQQMKKIIPKEAVHQGIIMEIEDISYGDITDLVSSPNHCIIAILDNVTDPHNLGAIIRTAAAFGISGIILSERSSCKITPAAAKAASGGLEHISIYIVKNISQSIEKIKEYGFWVISCCESGNKFIHEVDLKGKVCVILGAEGDGIRRLSKEKSDFVVKIPTNTHFSTLNVSNAAAVVFYEIAKQQAK